MIPHPVFPSDPPATDDTRTLLCLGVIRPYKGLGDAIEAAKRLDGVRLLVAGDPAEPIDRLPAGTRARCRLAARLPLRDAEVDRVLGESSVGALPLPGRADQSGALLRALGAGVPAVVYDVGRPRRARARFGPGRVVAAQDVEALAGAARRAARRSGGARGGARRRSPAPARADAGTPRRHATERVPGARLMFRRALRGPVRRQLDLFKSEHGELLGSARRPSARTAAPAAPDAEESLRGLPDLRRRRARSGSPSMRDTYASTLAEDDGGGVRAGLQPRRAEAIPALRRAPRRLSPVAGR